MEGQGFRQGGCQLLLFFICYFLSYKIAANQYKIKSASQAAANAEGGEAPRKRTHRGGRRHRSSKPKTEG